MFDEMAESRMPAAYCAGVGKALLPMMTVSTVAYNFLVLFWVGHGNGFAVLLRLCCPEMLDKWLLTSFVA